LNGIWQKFKIGGFMSKLKQQRKENNQCVYCGKNLDREGIYCVACNAYWNKYKFEHYSRTQHEQGKCTDCGNILDREGWFCSVCVEKLRKRGKSLADYRRHNGLCVQCGTQTDGYSYCQKHRDERMDRYYAKKG
jgi:hypothetical protein